MEEIEKLNSEIEKVEVRTDWVLPAAGEKRYDSGAQGTITVTRERQAEFFKHHALVMTSTLMAALSLSQIHDQRLYQDAGFSSMNEYLIKATAISRQQGQLYVRIAQTFKQENLIGEDGQPSPLGLLGVTKLDVLNSWLMPDEKEELIEAGEFLGPDDKWYTVADLMKLKVPELRNELKDLRKVVRDAAASLETSKAEVEQLREERKAGKTGSNLIAEMDELRNENLDLKGLRDAAMRGEKALGKLNDIKVVIFAHIKILAKWQMATAKDYAQDPMTFGLVEAICAESIAKLTQIRERIQTLSDEVNAEE